MNKKGQAHLFGLILFSILSFMAIFHLSHIIESRKEIDSRLKTYTCAKNLSDITRKHIQSMNGLNFKIRAVYIAMKAALLSSPAGYRILHITWKSLQKLQDFKYFSFMKKIKSLKSCSRLNQVSFLVKYIYKRKSWVKLKRDVKGTLQLRKKKWNKTILDTSKKFFLKMEYSLKGPFKKKHRLKVQEIDYSSLKVKDLLSL